MKTNELRELSSEDLRSKVTVFKKELFDLRFQRQMGAVDKPSQFRNNKRMIARILTILKERDMSNGR